MKLFTSILLIAFTFISCEKISFDKEEKQSDKVLKIDKSDDNLCFVLVYPIAYELPDGTIITINNKEDWQLLKDWHSENEDVTEKPQLEYPIEIEYYYDKETSKIISISNAEELYKAKDSCSKNEDKECFKLLLPVTYKMPDGLLIEIVTIADWQILKDWYSDNEDVIEKPQLVYPVDIKFYKTDVQKTISTEVEMFEVKKKCN